MKTALEATGIPFADTAWQTAPEGTYGVYQIDFGGDTLFGDGEHLDQVLHGSVDLFVAQGDSVDQKAAAVTAALKSLSGIPWRLESRQYEKDTRLTHLEWTFESVG
ncbi:MAG: hypothetical protein J6S60_04850 [Oscillospiraceae bacterium]|nr:hypothetical protein [Oscillospiraceae bacterium]